MATSKLSAVDVSKKMKPGIYGDGGGLWLQITPTKGKSWSYRFMLRGKAREMGLGPYPAITLAEARQKAGECRRVVLAGLDPIEARIAERAAAASAAARGVTFKEVATQYIAAHEGGWKNAKHKQQWRNTLDTYALPVLGDTPVAAVVVGDVMRILEPIWRTTPETASRVRGRVESILDYATARGWRTGENPARWRGHLQNLLPPTAKVAKVEHHAALPWQEIGAFMAELRGKEMISARGLEFLILTATRTGEAIGAKWSEIDLQAAVWTIPAERMKAATEHRVPLSAPALSLLRTLAKTPESEWVFPGGRKGKPLSNMAFLELLRRMDRGDLTAHGFRSTFRDWTGETTGYPRDVAEAALAHTLKDKVEAAYRRGDLMEKRRALMAEWARFCDRPAVKGEVIPIHKYG
jgi:integrase